MDALLLIDAHVHVHKCTDVAAMLTAAKQNFAAAARHLDSRKWRGMLLLTEMAHRNWFAECSVQRDGATFGSWRVMTAAPDAVEARAIDESCDDANAELTIVAGRQIITSERIEVLALGTRERVGDGSPLEATIAAAQAIGALVVLPWGAGKWLGRRGQLVGEALARTREIPIFAGDNRGRLPCLGLPRAFRMARLRNSPIVPGTDPLALPREEGHVGSYGLAVRESIPHSAHGNALRTLLLRNPNALHTYGSHVGPLAFMRNQLGLRIQNERHP